MKNEAKVVLYFTQRIVFALGIGNKQVEFGRFHGPIELIDIEPSAQETLLLPLKFKDSNSPDPRVQKFGKDVITCLQYKVEDRGIMQELQESLLKKTLSIIYQDFPDLQYKNLSEEEMVSSFAHKLKKSINKFLTLRKEVQELGDSLYHLGTLRNLGEERKLIGLALLENPNGLSHQEIIKKIDNKLNSDKINSVIQELIEMGYVEILDQGPNNSSIRNDQVLYRVT